MREARMILPRKDNNGGSLTMVHAGLKRAICEAFGGFTALSVEGGWKDDSGNLYVEEGVAYDIACETSEENENKLLTLAAKAAKDARQICVYLRLPSGEVRFVEPVMA